MKTSSLAIALLVCATLWPDVASARSKGGSSHEYRVVSGGHSHSSRGYAFRPTFFANRYPRFYPTTSRSNFIALSYPSYQPPGYRVVQFRRGSQSRYAYGSHIGYIGRPYIHVRNGRDGCHPYTHHYHHDDWRHSHGHHD
jgi:hypothetical protein